MAIYFCSSKALPGAWYLKLPSASLKLRPIPLAPFPVDGKGEEKRRIRGTPPEPPGGDAVPFHPSPEAVSEGNRAPMATESATAKGLRPLDSRQG